MLINFSLKKLLEYKFKLKKKEKKKKKKSKIENVKKTCVR